MSPGREWQRAIRPRRLIEFLEVRASTRYMCELLHSFYIKPTLKVHLLSYCIMGNWNFNWDCSDLYGTLRYKIFAAV